MAIPSINNLNNLMQSVHYRNSLPTATKTPILDRYQYSGHGADWGQSGWAGSNYGHSSQGSSGGGKKSNIALSALTLLAFLFFLNILQNCIQDHLHDMQSTNTTGMIVMTTAAARRRFNRFNRHKVGRRSVLSNDTGFVSAVLGNSELLESVKLFNATVGSSSNLERFYDLLGKSLKTKYGDKSAPDLGLEEFEDVEVIEGGFKGDFGEATTIAGVRESSIERNFVPAI